MRDVVVAGATGSNLQDPVTGKPVGKLLGGRIDFPRVPSPDGRLFLGEFGRSLGIWDVATHRLLSRLPDRSGTPTAGRTLSALNWSSDGKLVAANAGALAIDVWDVSDPQHLSRPQRIQLPGNAVIDDLEFMPGSNELVVLSGNGSMQLSLVDVDTGHPVWTTGVGSSVQQFAISPDGTSVAYDGGTINAGHVVVLDTASGKPRLTFDVPSFGGVGYLDHGQWLLVTSDQPGPAAQLFDATTGQTFGVPFPTADLDQGGVSIDPSGTRFTQSVTWNIYAPTSFDPLLWTVDPASWIRTACGIASRNLTRTEWQQYLPDQPYRVTCPGWPAG
jgi:WD40 repeat protein